MTDFDALLRALPHAPDFAYDWAALEGFPTLAGWFSQMKNTQQHAAWHGEGDVMAHTRLVCEALAALEEFRKMEEDAAQALALAALLHDIGKPACTRLEDGVLRSPRHGPVGSQMARTALWTEFGLAGDEKKRRFREAACLLIRYHTLPLHLFEKTGAAAHAMKIAANGELAPLFTWRSLCLLSEADVRGRIAEDTPSKLEDVRLSREIAREAGCLDGPYPFRAARTAWAVWQGKAVWPEQEMYDDTWGEILLLCGLPGTGKDTFARQSALPAVSLDDTRRRMGVRREDEQGAVIQAAKEEARKYLRGRQPFVWNATCLTRKNRSELTRLFESYGARVRIVYLETDWEENLRRNRDREAAVPESALGRMLDKLEPPERNEAQAVEWRTV